jgi:prepilin-type N-terminal cleavage/methylation domain-containing protein
MRNHRGFTLAELLIVLIIMGVVTGGIYKLLNTTQRVTRAQAERVDLQSNVRTASIVIPAELREINTFVGGTVAQNDILVMNPTSIQYRAMRGIGFTCAGTTTTQLRIRDYNGLRTPGTSPRDSVYVFNDGANPDVGTDDTWLPRRITGTVAGNTCGGAGVITLNIDALPSVPPAGTPVRAYEVMELSLYQQNGKSWLGMRSVSNNEAVQPLLGPLKDADGLNFSYLNAAGAVTATKENVRSIVLTVRGVTSLQVASGGNSYNTYVQDSLVTQVSLRNALR